jgi:hypothetical protein
MRTRSFLLRSTAVLSILAVVSLVAAFAFNPTSVAHDETGEVNATIYRSLGASYPWLQELDSQTLGDLESATLFEASFLPWTAVFSRDGSTMAAMTDGGQAVIQRSVSGSEISRFPVGGGSPVALNANGSKVLVRIQGSTFGWWRVIDTATGEMLIEIEERTSFGGPGLYQVDPVDWTLYRLVERITLESKPGGHRPVELVAYDLTLGREIARTDVPGVEMGVQNGRYASELADTSLEHAGFVPGFALSPDGTELAIVHATDDGITLIDTATLQITRTLTIHQKSSRLDRLFSYLPLAPQSASAKFNEGTVRTAFYDSDGDQLYVSGNDATFDDLRGYEGFGLSVISLDDGAIERTVLDDVSVGQLIELDDGRLAVSAVHYGPGRPREPAGTLIATLEPDATSVIKKRLLPDFVTFVIVPSTAT